MKVYLKNDRILQLKVENNEDRKLVYQLGKPYEIKGFVEVEITHKTMHRILAYKNMITYFDGKIFGVYDRYKKAEEQRIKEKAEAKKRRKLEIEKLEQQRQQAAIRRLQAEQQRQLAEQQRYDFLTKEIPIIEKSRAIKRRFFKEPELFKNNPSCSSFLMPHQVAGCELANLFDKYAFFYDTGTGKTVMALEIIKKTLEKENFKFLIVCPKTIINTAWMADCATFYSTFKLLPLSKNITPEQYWMIYKKWRLTEEENYERLYIDDFTDGKRSDRIEFIQKALIPRANAFIINPESFNVEFFIKLNIKGIIVDESAILKNYNSLISKKVQDFASQMQYTYLLSGKPAPNRYAEYYSQMKIVDSVYLNRSFEVYSRTNDIAKDIDRKSFTLSKEDCFDLPPKSYIIRTVVLEKKAREKYNEMYWSWSTEYQKELKERKNVAVGNHLSALRKLRQIASGFIINNVDKKSSGDWIHDSKKNELRNILDDLGNNQAIIWGQHRYEIEVIEKLLQERGESVVTAYGKTKDNDQSIEAFKSGKARYIVAHPRTLMYGVTLTNCTYAIYYSTSYSHEEYYQSHDRIYRLGQEKPCTYIFIQAQNTVDELMYDCIQKKKSESEFFEALLRSIKDTE